LLTDFDQDGAEDIYVADMWTAAGERISSQEIFKKDAPEDVRAPVPEARDGQLALSKQRRCLRGSNRRRRSRNGTLVMVERLVRFRS